MKTNRYILLLTALFMGLTSAIKAQTNKLYIPDVSIQKGKTIVLPVYVDNSSEIVAAQFTLQLPSQLTLSTSSATMNENRADDHTVTVRNLGNDKYMFMVMSPKNATIKGRTGALFTIPLQGRSTIEEGATYDLTMSGAVLSAKSGRNVLTDQSAGKITVKVRPDLLVSNVAFEQTSIAPEQTINVSWRVENVGGMATADGFNESIYLVDANGHETYIGKTSFDGVVAVNGTLSRTAEITLPNIIGIDGASSVKVTLRPNSSECEPQEAAGNNTSISTAKINIAKQLYISSTHSQLYESSPGNYYFYINRSGNKFIDETFTLTCTSDSRITIPASVTIPKGSSGERFIVSITNNTDLDDIASINISAEGNDYAKTTKAVAVVDDEIPTLFLTADGDAVGEGESMKFTLSVNRAPVADLPIKLSTDFPRRFKLPENVVIAAGKTNVKFAIESLENDDPDIEQVVTLYASATDHNTGEAIFALVDNDIPTLEMQITPNAISETAGPLAMTAQLHRVDKLDKVVTVKLSDDSEGGIYYGTKTITFNKGVEYATVKLGPIDNLQVDGERTYNITAAVYIASCSCNASIGSVGGIVTAPVTFYDNDGPTLSLQSPTSVLKEGTEANVTVTRNTETSQPLTVNISCKETGIEYPAQVTIPAGSASVTFAIKSTTNDVTGDGFVTTITAEAEGYAKGNVWFTVSDVNLPDAQITDISVSEDEAVVGGKVDVSVTITNTGAWELPEQTKTNFYFSGDSETKATHYLQNALQPGESICITKTVEMPSEIANYNIYAVANADNTVSELSLANNTSKTATVSTIAPFTVKVSTDKPVYSQSEPVVISGSILGSAAEGQEIEVYLINEGYRNVIKAKTDDKGKFTATFEPNISQMGHFIAGACYPGEKLTKELASFDIYGIRRSDASYIKFYPIIGKPYNGSFSITNPGNLDITGLQASVISKADNCTVTLDCPSSIAAGQTAVVSYTLTSADESKGDSWEKAVLSITADEGAQLETTLYYYTKYAEAKLKSSTSSIDATMQKGNTREYPITIKNEGIGETGKITLSLPSWMRSATPTEMASLAPGESAEVILLFTPNNDMQINVPVTGTIGINCEHGDGVAISYIVEPVSDAKGNLLVDVCDEYTYNTSEAPHVAGAKVKISHPYTGAEIATGETDESGKFNLELPEGYYRIMITADKHETYNNYISINAGRTEKVTVNISYQPITVSWDVEETTVEDEYRIITTVKYETNVPAPVVKVTLPERIDGDNMAVGDVTMINMTLTNIGLIRAENVDLLFPKDNEEWKFEPLAFTDLFTLAPQQSVTIPIRITRISDPSVNNVRGRHKSAASTMIDTYAGCMSHLGAMYEFMCGEDWKNNRSAKAMAMKFCAYAATMAGILDGLGFGGGGGLGAPSGGGGGVSGSGNYNGVSKTLDICDPASAKRAKAIIDAGLGLTGLGMFDGALDECIDATLDGRDLGPADIAKFAVKQGVEKYIGNKLDGVHDGLGNAVDGYNAIKTVVQGNLPDDAKSRLHKAKSQYDEAFDNVAYKYIDQFETLESILQLIYGDPIWYYTLDEGKIDFLDYITKLPDGYIPTDEEIRDHKPESVSFAKSKEIILYYNGMTDNLPTVDDFMTLFVHYKANNDEAKEAGYKSMFDQFEKAFTTYEQHLKDMQGSSVCASITLQFSQTMTMTRQAFRGTLTVFNGHETTAMQDVRLNLVVKNSRTGQIATSHEFQINPETLKGFNGKLDLNSGWTLAANETGVATIIFIPTKYAAPTEAENYSFGGTLVYIDPYTGLEVTRDLYPITMTVKPSPILDLTYFMQRDVIADDPLTAEVEPSEEAEFSLLVNNKGYGDATNVKMVTDQPQIIDNQKGLLIDFELMSSQLNGGDKTLALGSSVATDFGTIPAMSSIYAQWWFKSSLLGHFVDYNVEATHITSYGNEDLSLLDQVTIHELIRSLNTNGDIAFLVNDIQDANDTPDMLYLTSGDIEPVTAPSSATLTKMSSTQYELNVTPSLEGWFYGNLLDPTNGMAKIISVVRKSDGKEISTRNFWQTDRTLRDGKEPLYENRLHFAENANVQETYIISFEELPDQMLEVAAVEGIPAENQIAESRIESVVVTFNKTIDPATFSSEDITFAVQGVKQDASLISLSTTDNKSFTLDLSNIDTANGYYTLTIQTAGITDADGFAGHTGKTVTWTVYDAALNNLTFTDGTPYSETETTLYNTISYTRTFNNTEWQALYVPFSLNYSEWAGKAEVAKITHSRTGKGGDATADDIALEYQLIASGNTEPNTPYLIRALEEGPLTFTLFVNPVTYPATISSTDLSSAYTQFVLRGTYSGIDGATMYSTKYLAMSGGSLKVAKDAGANLLPQRWYLDAYNYDGYPFNVSEVKLRPADTTSLDIIERSQTSDNNIYSVDGRLVHAEGNAKKLSRGVYIHNNKKFVVK